MGEQPFQWESGDPIRVRMLQNVAASQAAGRVKRLKKLAARDVTNMYSAICVLHLAEPELGVKAIVRRLGPQHRHSIGHHGIDPLTVRDVLQGLCCTHGDLLAVPPEEPWLHSRRPSAATLQEPLAQQQSDDCRGSGASAERQQHLDSLPVERLSTLSVSAQQPPLPCVQDGETTTPGLVHRRDWSDGVGPTMDLGSDDGPGPSSDGLTEAAASVSGPTLARLEKAAWACVGRLNPRDGDNRRLVRARLQDIGVWAVPGSSMLLFGSAACELHANGADLDLTLIPGPRPLSYAEKQALVRHLAMAFQPGQASGEFTQVTRGSGPLVRAWFGWFGW